MSIREQMANGVFEQTQTQKETIYHIPNEYEVPEENYFILKDKTRSERMEKSLRARQWRQELRSINQNRHRLGYHLD